ncbi:MAG: transcriptional repressor LexA [Firmicutes bacterium]|nr:transcriptional repressor LexA [Bacillota bacterium]
MKNMSKKQKAVLDFLIKMVREKGYPPSVREICDSLGIRSTYTAHGYLERLEKGGYIRRDPSKPRAIEILVPAVQSFDKFPEMVRVPIVGTITAGEPILATENIESEFPLPLEYAGGDSVFMLRVKGDSMIEAGIFDKDLILVREQPTAQNGEIVVAMIEDFATVKTFYKEDGHIRLQPENASMSPIILNDVKIVGEVIGLFRSI